MTISDVLTQSVFYSVKDAYKKRTKFGANQMRHEFASNFYSLLVA